MITIPAQPGVATPIAPSEEWLQRRMKFVFEHAEHIGNDISSQLPDELVFELEGQFFFLVLYSCSRFFFLIIILVLDS